MSYGKKSLLLAAGLLLLIGGFWLFFMRDSIAAEAIRKYGTAILGVKVSVSRVRTDLASQTVELRGLSIENPPGFNNRYLLRINSVTVSLDVSSLTKDVVLVHELLLLKPEVSFEKLNGRSNLEIVQGNLDRYIADTEKSLGLDAPKNDRYMKQSSKKWIIGHVFLKDGMATVSGINVRLPAIHIRDIGKRSGGASTADATKQVLSALTHNVAGAVGSVVGGAVKEVGGGVKKGVSKIGGKLKKLFGK